jgi:hypothetical protein
VFVARAENAPHAEGLGVVLPGPLDPDLLVATVSRLLVVSVHGRGGESAGHGVCGGGVGGGWSSGLSAKVELRRFSPDREGDR